MSTDEDHGQGSPAPARRIDDQSHSRRMWAAGTGLALAACAVLFLNFRNISNAALSTTISWVVFSILVAGVVLIWRRLTAASRDGDGRARTADYVDAGFLLRGERREKEKNVAQRVAKWLWVKKERDGLVGLAILCGVSISIASFYTTFMGSLTFFGYSPWQIAFAFLLALGIQGALYIASWMVAEEFATHSRVRLRNQPALRDQIFVKHFSKIASALVCAFASIFFSFASHFENVYGAERLALANVQNARSDTTKVLVRAETAIIDERNAVSERLKSSDEWAAFNNGLEQLLKVAEKQPDLMRKALNERRATVEGDLAKIRSEKEVKEKSLAEIAGKIEAIQALGAAPAATQANDNAALAQLEQTAATTRTRKLMFERAAEIELSTGNDPERVPGDECQAIARAQVANIAAAQTNAKNGKNGKKAASTPTPGRTARNISGPVHRCLLDNAKEADINLKKYEAEIARIKKLREGQLTAAASRNEDIGKLGAERARLTGEIAMLKSRETDAQQAYTSIDGHNQSVLSGLADGDLVKTVRGDRDEFLRAGNRTVFDRLIASCASLQDAIQRYAGAGQGATTQCDTSGLLAPIDRLTTLNVALGKYRESCAITQEFNMLGDPAKYVNKGSECLAMAKVPARTVAESNTLDRIAQLNHPATSPFERAVASLGRGDILAWLAAALAVSVDLLVYLSAALGARANSSVLQRRGRIASNEDLKDIISEDADIQIYGDEPKKVLRAKLFLSATSHRLLDPQEPMVPVVDLSRIPLRHRSNVRNFLNSVASADLAQALPTVDLYRVDQDLYLAQNRVVADFERVRELERGPRPWSEDDDFTSLGETHSDHTTTVTGGANQEQSKRSASPGTIADHPTLATSDSKRAAQQIPGPKKRYSGGWQ